jgi:hypothetical protein
MNNCHEKRIGYGYIGSRACEDREAITLFGTDHETPAPPLRRTPLREMLGNARAVISATKSEIVVLRFSSSRTCAISEGGTWSQKQTCHHRLLLSQRRRAQANLSLGAIKRATHCCIATLGIDERPLLNWGH